MNARASSSNPVSPTPSSRNTHDVIVIGAGPAGCATALAHAQKGARVLLLEANPAAANRLAGEWLHPEAVEILLGLGVDLHADSTFESGHGFAVFPEDGSEAIRLPYSSACSSESTGLNSNRRQASANSAMASGGAERRGWSGEHRTLVNRLREAASARPEVSFLDDARVVGIDGQRVSYKRKQQKSGAGIESASAALIIGADGRTSRARAALGMKPDTRTVSRMAGLQLSDVTLPFEGAGHVLLGGPGPVLAYRIGDDRVRLCIDVPSDSPTDPTTLWEAYARILPESFRRSFRRELTKGAVVWAANQIRPRTAYGRPGLCLIGDAVGYRHPLTAAGITLGIADGAALAEAQDFSAWARARQRDTKVADMLGGVLYEVFAENTDATVAIREGIYRLWRKNPNERVRTMRYLSGEPGQQSRFAATFSRIALPALFGVMANAAVARDGRRARDAFQEIGRRAGWLLRGAFRGPKTPTVEAWAPYASGEATLADVSKSSSGRTRHASASSPSARSTLEAGVRRLVALQSDEADRPGTAEMRQIETGSWEGEVAWCPMLAAQYVIFSKVIGLEISDDRRRGLLRHFETTQLDSGLWGLHRLSEPYLFVTTLVYVAARLLGVDAHDGRLTRAGAFIRNEDVTRIPSWGKLWLAIAGLYDWRGVPPVVPELWALPKRLPIHPSNFYCHTRQIYLSMSALYARKVRPPEEGLHDSTWQSIREELYDGACNRIDWTRARRSLRRAELVTPPSGPLRLAYEIGSLFERHHSGSFRRRVLADLESRIRWEMQATDHIGLSPVNGMLAILALWAADPADPEIKPATERLGFWIWDDEALGVRIAGARSASWDTAFALDALSAAKTHCDVSEADEAIERGTAYLLRQQIRTRPEGHDDADRLDPQGGWSFTNAAHGWPVSDCTAEAVEALLRVDHGMKWNDTYSEALAFILRCQNHDGGFGSYEAKRPRIDLEWLNPAEMFGDSMTEHTYVECTGSCIAALANLIRRFPDRATPQTREAIGRAVSRLRALQGADGGWEGVWAVHFIYGTLFGIRGLVAAGVPASDPALYRARRFVLDRQRPDGGWGEAHEGCVQGRSIENEQSQFVHTAWALLALLEADEPDWRSIERGAAFLMAGQDADGSWPRQDPPGLFFRTALLDYDLYRQTFPVWALSLYESRRKVRQKFHEGIELESAVQGSGAATSDRCDDRHHESRCV